MTNRTATKNAKRLGMTNSEYAAMRYNARKRLDARLKKH